MDKLRVAAEATTGAAPETVWALVSDARRYPEWGPWSTAGFATAGPGGGPGIGAVHWVRSAGRSYGRHVPSIERIVAFEPGRHLAYEVVGGIPVRNYRADVTLTPEAGGTHIDWTAAWDATLMGRLVWRQLRVFYPEIVAALAVAAERQEAAAAP
jgi:uncharacterized protein YndB with AHSA1/START domain